MSEQPETPSSAPDLASEPSVADAPAVSPPEAAASATEAAGPPPGPVAPPPPAPASEQAPAPDFSSSESGAADLAERPEVAAGAAFAGGLILALILKRLAR